MNVKLCLALVCEGDSVCMQGCWWDESSLLMLPNMDGNAAGTLAAKQLSSVARLLQECRRQPACARAALEEALGSTRAAEECLQVCSSPDLFSTIGSHQRE